MTPRSRNAVPSAGSPDKLLARTEAEALWNEEGAAGTECTTEQEARHDLLAAHLGGMDDASHDEIAFIIWVDQLIPEYRSMYGSWLVESPELEVVRSAIPLQQFALARLFELDSDKFESEKRFEETRVCFGEDCR